MRHALWMALLLLPWAATELPAQAAPDGTPERAIQDMALASKPEEIMKHLPVSALDAVKTLDPEDRLAFETSLMWRQSSPGEKPDLEIPGDGHAFLVMHGPEAQLSEAYLTDSVVTGGDAVLRFAVGGPERQGLEVQVWMRFEEGEWRIREADTGRFGRRIRFDDPEFVERFRNRQQKANESLATSTLYTVSYALQRYAEVRPDVGFPDDLSLLAEPISGDADDDSGDVSFSFLSADLARNDFVREGYRFHYQLIHGGPQGAYLITARPVDRGESGRSAYCIDETARIHQTDEDRDATSEDPVLNGNE